MGYIAVDQGVELIQNIAVAVDKPEGTAAATQAELDELMPDVEPCLSAAEEDVLLDQLDLPDQDHHFVTDKNKTHTDDFQEIIDTVDPGHTLNESWNKEVMPHRGRHPGALWVWLKKRLEQVADEADQDWSRFIDLFDRYIKGPVLENPLMLRKVWWDCFGDEVYEVP